MKTYTVRFIRHWGDDCAATRRSLLAPGSLTIQLRREFLEACTHELGAGAFHSLTLRFHRFAKNGDTYGIEGRIDSPLRKPLFVRALQGLYDRGMDGEFIVVNEEAA
jgi:hypothetical protein